MADPFTEMMYEMQRIQHEMNKLQERLFQRVPLLPTKKGALTESRAPVTSLKETESDIIANIELPGMDKEDIHLNVTPTKVEVSAKQKVEKEKKGYYAASERRFYKAFTLPAEVDPNAVDASYKNGVLHLKLKKVKTATQKKRILIK